LLYDTDNDDNERERQIDSSVGASEEDLWADVLKDIREQINIHSYNTWFKNNTGKFEGDIFVVSCPNFQLSGYITGTLHILQKHLIN
jgi:hypothetical protein